LAYAFSSLVPLAARAVLELIRARIILASVTPQEIIARNERAAPYSHARDVSVPPGLVADDCLRIAFILPRIAARIPWRSDCLVQALAGQNWLRAKGIASQITIGAAKDETGAFEAHAWLSHQGEVVLGGDITKFKPLLDPQDSPKSIRPAGAPPTK
jgi:hypothetical protein